MNETTQTAEPQVLGEVERKVILELCEQADKLFQEFQSFQADYQQQMMRYQEQTPERTDFHKPNAFQLKWAIPQTMYHWLRQVAPDGMKNFDQNLDFMRFLKEKYPWMAQFPNADKPWEQMG